MGKAALRNLMAHKGRLVLSLLAVVLSAGFVAGTLIFTDTLTKTFDDLFADTTSDVVVSPPSSDTPQGGDFGEAVATPTLPASTLAQVEQAPGIAAAAGDVLVEGLTIIGSDGKPLGTAGAPTLAVNWEGDERLSPLRLVEGKGPGAPGEMAIDSQAADKGALHVGDQTTVVTPAGTKTVTVVGVFRFGASGNLAGASLGAFTTPYVQDLMLGGSRNFTTISAAADPGVSQDQAANSVRAVVASNLKVQTGAESADETAKQITDGLGFFRTFLLVFAGVSVFVGLFLIYNTFAMLVAQRTRELALFRAMGAARGQVIRSVLLEGLVVGLVGALLGVLGGVGLAFLLRAVFKGIGIDFPAGSLVIRPTTIIAALVVGVGATFVGSLLPALRAARVSPVAAMRDDFVIEPKSLRVRTIIGIALFAIAAVGVALGLKVDSLGAATSLVGVSFLLSIIAVIVLGPALTGPLITILGWPFRGTFGRIAVGNALRNRRRTALTAAALTIGLALVGATATLAASFADSTDAAIDEAVKADFIISSTNFAAMPVPVTESIKSVDGIGVVSAVRFVPGRWTGGDTSVVGVDPTTFAKVTGLEFTADSAPDISSALANNGLVLDTKTATANSIKIGDPVVVTYASGKQTYTVAGLYAPQGFFSGLAVSNASLDAAGAPKGAAFIYATVGSGSDSAAVRAGIDAALADTPTVQVQDLTEFKDSFRAQINQLLGVIYVLLALSLLVAVLGIINTVALSVVERTREIGLLRAIGTSRRQLRAMIRVESLVTSVFGAVLGLLIGVFFGQALVRALKEQGLSVVSTPWTSLIVFLVLAALVGILAAAWPARRAARMDVLQAIATE